MVNNPILDITDETVLYYTDMFEIDYNLTRKYIDGLIQHVSYVIEFGNKIGGIPNLLSIHDLSKLNHDELPHYIKRFTYENVTDEIKLGFGYAWHHHVIHNPHHHEHWVISPKYILAMPSKYIREMVADWHGANRTYQGNWDSTEWLQKNLNKISLHNNTRKELYQLLIDLGYDFLKGDEYAIL
jgi:hypothetical protein